LKEDQRNFHCWNYRRTIFEMSGLPNEHEIAFCMEKIQENFSNYSAFHQRSIYIKHTGLTVIEVIDQEWSLVENAIFTEPDDQSAWWYYQFLISYAIHSVRQDDTNDTTWLKELMYKHYDVIKSLLEMEPNSRWAMMILVFLSECLLTHCKNNLTVEEKESMLEERKHFLITLLDIDPIHQGRYRYLQNMKFE
jgi:geranylgeranyl transferase type-2 subunit alpha